MSLDQLNDLQPSDRTSDTAPANAPQSTPTLRESIKDLLAYIMLPTTLLDDQIKAVESLLSDRIREARINELERQLSFHYQDNNSKDFHAGFNEAIDQFADYRKLRIKELKDGDE